jgi:hypothetical protein
MVVQNLNNYLQAVNVNLLKNILFMVKTNPEYLDPSAWLGLALA